MLPSHPVRGTSIRRWPLADRLICAGFLALFVCYALNFAYFFVDDSAIPFVYAQNVLEGHGLVYNVDDGPVEGYSDFLSIGVDVAILAAVNAAGGSKLSALAAGRAVAFACGAGVVAVTFAALRQRSRGERAPLVAGMTFLTLAGPLAVWSWSALETTLFALLTALLVTMLLEVERVGRRRAAALLGTIVAMMLCRSDGFVWVGALGLPFLMSAEPARRRWLLRRVIVPAVGCFVAYQGWRIWYFGELFPMPIYAKVLYKLQTRDTLIANDPARPYIVAFLETAMWLPAVALILGFAGAYQRDRAIASLAVGVVSLFGYLSLVGDWMFGFRFFVPLLAPLAIVAAAGFQHGSPPWPRLARPVAGLWILAVVLGAGHFWRTYARDEQRDSWLVSPSLDPARFYSPYYQVYLDAAKYVTRGDTLAYNQAGFVPFMLGVRNVDDLGICTKFYAKLPTTDVVFTEVGRYSPLTSRPVLRASESYTRARRPKLLLEPAGNIRAANGGNVPDRVLGGAYRLEYATDAVAAYRPAPDEEWSDKPIRYLENLAHISHLRRVGLNGARVPRQDYRARLPYLYGERAQLAFDGGYVAEFTFSDVDADVSELYIASIRSDQPASIELALLTTDGRVVFRQTIAIIPNQTAALHVDADTKASRLSLIITGQDGGSHAVDLTDLRVQGQSPALKRFIYHAL